MHCAGWCGTAAFLGLALLQASAAYGQSSSVIKQAPPLPPPGGPVIRVRQDLPLYPAVNAATTGTTVLISPGTYLLGTPLQLNVPGVTIRGATGNPDDVVLLCGFASNGHLGNAEYAMHVNVNDITIADLTISFPWYHGIQIRGENDASNILIHNVKIFNAGERFIKGSTATGHVSSNVTVEYCWLEQDLPLTGHSDNDYIGGIDAIGISNWRIRDCVIKNIKGATGGGRGGIFLWGGAANCVAERNCIIGCDRGIAFGNPSRTVPYHTTNGVIRNNVVVRGAGYGVELCATNNLQVYSNTVYSSSASANTVHVYDSVTTGLKLYNDIIRGQIYWHGASGSSTGTITGSSPLASWFVDPLNGDLRLTSVATAAIDTAPVLAEVADDYFARPRGSQPDKGAYERAPPHVTAVTPALGYVSCKDIPLTAIGITFDADVTISAGMVSVSGANTGAHNDFTFSYSSAPRTATLQWPAGLPDDTYQVIVSDTATTVGLALDGEIDPLSPVLPSGNGVPGGSFVCLVYRLVADTNEDRSVDVVDLLNFVATFGLLSGDPGFDATCDFNSDGAVDVVDLLTLVSNFGETIPQQ
jgi:hypothetical protein